MCKKLMFLITFVAMLLAGSAYAADYSWTNAYEFSVTWDKPWNWSPDAPMGGPGVGDTAFIGIADPIVVDTDVVVSQIRGPAWGASEGSETDEVMWVIKSATLEVTNDWRVEETNPYAATINVIENAVINISGSDDDQSFRSHGNNQSTIINISDDGQFLTNCDLRCGDDDDDYFELNMTDNAYMYTGECDDGFRFNEGEGHVSVSGYAVLEAEYVRWRCRTGGVTSTWDITENAQVITTDAHFRFSGGSSDVVINILDNAYLETAEHFIIGEDNSYSATTTVTMDGDPLVYVNDDLKFFDDGTDDPAEIIFNLNDGLISVGELNERHYGHHDWTINIVDGVMIIRGRNDSATILDQWAQGLWKPYPYDIGGGETIGRGDLHADYDTLEYPGDTKVYATIELCRAWNPNPKDGTTDVASRDLVITWSSGDGAISHHAFFSSDLSQVQDRIYSAYVGDLSVTNFEPGPLDLGETYYWCVDEEIPGAVICRGNIYEFTVEISRPFEGFEEYSMNPNYIYDTWIDGDGDVNGVGGNGTGSSVNLSTAVVHSGSQSIVYYFDVVGPPFRDANYAEATRMFDPVEDWSSSNEKALSVWFYGDAGNEIEPMYMIVNGNPVSMATYGDNPADEPADIQNEEWQEWNVDLTAMADAGADIANIATLSLGFGDRVGGVAGTEQEGCVYFDDMILHTTRCVAEQSQAVIDDLDGDCDVDWSDIGIVTGNWLEDRR
jgi:hypothetical protein